MNNEIILYFASIEDIQKVTNAINDLLQRYSSFSMADLMDLVGLETKYEDTTKGWTRFNLEIKEAENGYLLVLPAMEAI